MRNESRKQLLDFISGSVLINHVNVMNTHFFNCFPRLKWSLLDGWKTSTDGAVGEHPIQGCVTLKEVNLVCSCVAEAHQARSDTEKSRSADGWQWALMDESSRLLSPLSVHIREAWTNSQAEYEHGLSLLLFSLRPESWCLCLSLHPRRRLSRTPCWKQARGRNDAGILPINARTWWSDLTETVEPGHKDLTACMSASSWGWRCRSAASCRDKH